MASSPLLREVGAPAGGGGGSYVRMVPSTAAMMRQGGASSGWAGSRGRYRTATYSLPRALIGNSSWWPESQAWSAGSMFMQLAPPQTPIGLVDLIGVPFSSSGWRNWRTWPALMVYVVGTPIAA